MKTITVDITEYLDTRWKTYEEEVKACDLRKSESVTAADQIAQSTRILQDDLANKEALKKQASENGLDTTPLDKDIIRIRVKINELQKQHDEEKRLANQQYPVAPFDRWKASRFAQHLREIKHDQVCVLPSLEAAASLLTVTRDDLTVDKDGIVIKVNVRFAKHHIGEVPISLQHRRYAKSFRPEALKWVPSLAGEDSADTDSSSYNKTMTVFIVDSEHTLLLPTKYEFRHDPYHDHSSRTEKYHESCMGDENASFVFASNILLRALKDAGGSIRLNETYTDSFLARIREEILGLTLDKPRWMKNTERPNSATVLASIGDDLSLVAGAPWSDDIDGPWAKLKHTLENGERPRVWRKEHVDHYGLRLRTRDHSWLVCDMFIDCTQKAGEPGEPIQVIRHTNIRKIGRMHMWVGEQKDD